MQTHLHYVEYPDIDIQIEYLNDMVNAASFELVVEANSFGLDELQLSLICHNENL